MRCRASRRYTRARVRIGARGISAVTRPESRTAMPLQSSVGTTDAGTFSITQTGATLSGTRRASSTGFSCTYSGTADANSIAFGWTSCDVEVLVIGQCFFPSSDTISSSLMLQDRLRRGSSCLPLVTQRAARIFFEVRKVCRHAIDRPPMHLDWHLAFWATAIHFIRIERLFGIYSSP